MFRIFFWPCAHILAAWIFQTTFAQFIESAGVANPNPPPSRPRPHDASAFQDSFVSNCSLDDWGATVKLSSPNLYLNCRILHKGVFFPAYKHCVTSSSLKIFSDHLASTPEITCTSDKLIRIGFEFLDAAGSPVFGNGFLRRWYVSDLGIGEYTYRVGFDHYTQVSTRYTITVDDPEAEMTVPGSTSAGGTITVVYLIKPPPTSDGDDSHAIDTVQDLAIYTVRPGFPFLALEESVLIPCMGGFEHNPFVYEIEHVGDSCLASQLVEPALSHDLMRGVHINLTHVPEYAHAAHSFLCCSSKLSLPDTSQPPLIKCPGFGSTPAPGCVEFHIRDPPDLLFSPSMPADGDPIRLFTDSGSSDNSVQLKLECSFTAPIELVGSVSLGIVGPGSVQVLCNESTADEKCTAGISAPRPGPDAGSGSIDSWPRRFAVSYETRLQIFDWLNVDCRLADGGGDSDGASEQHINVLYNWNATVHDVRCAAADDPDPAHLKFKEVSAPGALRADQSVKLNSDTDSEDEDTPPYIRCYSDVYNDTRLLAIACNNELECHMLEWCFHSTECGDRVSVGNECIAKPGGDTECQSVGQSCCEAPVGSPGTLLMCSAGGHTYTQLRWVGLSEKKSFVYERTQLSSYIQELITLQSGPNDFIEPEPAPDPGAYYADIPYNFTCRAHTFWTHGRLTFRLETFYPRAARVAKIVDGRSVTRVLEEDERWDFTVAERVEITFHEGTENRLICRAPMLDFDMSSVSGWISAQSTLIKVYYAAEKPIILNNETTLVFEPDEEDKGVATERTVDCLVEGRPAPIVNWTRTGPDGKEIPILPQSLPAGTDPVQDQVMDVYVVNMTVLAFSRLTKELQGTFTCTAVNPAGEDAVKFSISLASEDQGGGDGGTLPIGTVVGVVIAGFLVFVTLTVLLVYRVFLRRRRVIDKIEMHKFRHGISDDAQETYTQTGEQNEGGGAQVLANGAAPPRSWLEDVDAKPFDQTFEVGRHKFTLDKSRKLGAGEYGKVYAGEMQRRGEDSEQQAQLAAPAAEKVAVAIKVPQRNCPETILTGLLRELKIMTCLHHENVVRLLGANTTRAAYGVLFIIMEFCEEGSLLQFCERKKCYYDEGSGLTTHPNRGQPSHYLDLRFGFTQLLRWCKQIATGMEFLAGKGIVHRDLAARNILLGDALKAKISDFGLSRQLYGDPAYKQKTVDQKLPCRWMALECFTGTFSTQSDVWAYGILLWEIFSLGQLPYAELDFTEAAQFAEALRTGVRITDRQRATPEIFGEMSKCWLHDPSQRPSFTMMKEFFSGSLPADSEL